MGQFGVNTEGEVDIKATSQNQTFQAGGMGISWRRLWSALQDAMLVPRRLGICRSVSGECKWWWGTRVIMPTGEMASVPSVPWLSISGMVREAKKY